MGFEQLAHELPENERNTMLKEIKKSPPTNRELELDSSGLDKNESILIETEAYSKNKKIIEKAKEKLSFFQRIILFFMRIFLDKSLEKLLEEQLLKKEAEAVENASIGLIDFKNQKLKEKFLTEISSVCDDIDIFSLPINYIIKENKIDLFYRYIVKREVPGFEETILRDINPENLYASEKPENLDSIKPAVIKIFDEKINSFEKEEITVISEYSKIFCYMEKLVTFPFESFKNLFISDISVYKTCHFARAKKPLAKLDTILSKLFTGFSTLDIFVEYLFDFYDTGIASTVNIKNENNITNNEILKEVSHSGKKKASKALIIINNFYTSIPFSKLLKVMHKNLSYKTGSLICEEDWFSVYKKLLKNEIENQVDEYIFLEKKKRFLQQMKGYINEISMTENDGMTITSEKAQYNLRNCNILYYLYVVFEKFYVKNLEQVISQIIIDGIFYKDTNKKELRETFSMLNTFRNNYQAFIARIGEGSISYIASEKAIGKKEDAIIKSISLEGYKLYKNYFKYFISIFNILKGITSGSGAEKYDTLSNIDNLFGMGGIIPAKVLNKIFNDFSEIITILDEYNMLIISREYDW